MIRMQAVTGSLLWLLALFAASAAGQDDPRSAKPAGDREGIAFFEQKVLPVLKRHCYECHSRDSDEPKGGLRVDTREAIRAGGVTGEGIVPGNVDASLVIQAVRYIEDAYEMPPAGKLPDGVIRDLERWVQMGAPDPREEPSEKRQPVSTRQSAVPRPPARKHPRAMPPYAGLDENAASTSTFQRPVAGGSRIGNRETGPDGL